MSRKLYSEIDRVFKKVAEGIEDFEDCHDKVLNASNASQKEKYETDLKKEIKKLQRLRDQIKTWIQSNEIKDKQDLLHHRKLIEKQMEKFKAIEKEMKTKAFSKEGLLQSTKLDPKEKEKLDLCNWLVDAVDLLSTQVDVLEASAETIEGALGKKRRDPNKVEKLTQLQERVERHKYHIRCLERIQRLLENESLSTEQVQGIQEDVNYYVEENENEEFIEDECIYDELPLDDDDMLYAVAGDDDQHHSSSSSDSESESDNDNGDSDDGTGRERQSTPIEPEPSAVGSNVGGARSALGSKHASSVRLSTTTPAPVSATPVPSTVPTSTSAAPMAPQLPTLPPAPVESKNAWADVKESVLSPVKPGSTPAPAGHAHSLTNLAQPWAAVASQNAAAAANMGISAATPSASKQAAPTDKSTSESRPMSAAVTRPSTAAPVIASAGGNDVAQPQPQPPSAQAAANGPTKVSTQTPATAVAAPQQSAPTKALPRASTSPIGTKRASGEDQSRSSMQRPKYFTLFQDNEVPDAFADLMSTFMKAKQQFMGKRGGSALSAQRHMLDMSLQGMPGLLDQERPKLHGRGTQVNTPSYYPQTALPVIEHPGMASHLDLDTLFFAFYYQANTYQQYLAAKELNRQSWRFHKKYLTWFQRYEEPSDITDDYEQGTYVYFDYEGTWCQRRKSEFRFEYQYLEDTELA
ncbi:general negative regulator of transcription subunit 5 [Coemansia linderi]|uniref:General negative regulator of transcription subunit 5 n=1 Tax=Coemansia linderi TaxID=2663919 RepID=A0ACC1KIG7_9FUNG|nr:general negative regulator of transcription subunit 5 [Coemansia linderi]